MMTDNEERDRSIILAALIQSRLVDLSGLDFTRTSEDLLQTPAISKLMKAVDVLAHARTRRS